MDKIWESCYYNSQFTSTITPCWLQWSMLLCNVSFSFYRYAVRQMLPLSSFYYRELKLKRVKVPHRGWLTDPHTKLCSSAPCDTILNHLWTLVWLIGTKEKDVLSFAPNLCESGYIWWWKVSNRTILCVGRPARKALSGYPLRSKTRFPGAFSQEERSGFPLFWERKGLAWVWARHQRGRGAGQDVPGLC